MATGIVENMDATELRELECWIALNFMGYTQNPHFKQFYDSPDHPNGVNKDQCRFATDNAAAMQVLEKIIEGTKQTICLGRYHRADEPKRFCVYLGGTWEKTRQDGETLPIAISKFAKSLHERK